MVNCVRDFMSSKIQTFETELSFSKPLSRGGTLVGTAGPAAGSAFAGQNLCSEAFKVMSAGLGFFHDRDPANPLILGLRCQGLPASLECSVALQNHCEVTGYGVERWQGGGHMVFL